MSITLSRGLAEEAEKAVKKMLAESADSATFAYGESSYLVTAQSESSGAYYGSFALGQKTYSVYLLPSVHTQES